MYLLEFIQYGRVEDEREFDTLEEATKKMGEWLSEILEDENALTGEGCVQITKKGIFAEVIF